MKLDGVVYECVDGRHGGKHVISGMVLLSPIPGGLEVQRYEGGGASLHYEDHDIEDHEDQGLFILYQDTGKISFVRLTLPDFKRFEGPFFYDTPEFKNTDQLQSYFSQHITMDAQQ